jgi:2-(1,2-epoxy-1,2-dihydrophenyl)acetyl-CoA isomerase
MSLMERAEGFRRLDAWRRRRRTLGLVIVGVIVLIAAVYGVRLWRYWDRHVSTDDAFVETHVSPVSARVRGTVVEVLVRDNAEVRAVLVTGAGRAFCSGGDIAQMDPDRPPRESRRRMLKLLHEVFIPLAQLEKPVVAAVNGHAHGAGLSLAMACDLVFAARSAQFSLAFARLGLIPDCGALYFLPRLVGPARAKELVFSARRFGAEEAAELGLVHRVVDDAELLPTALEQARALAHGPTVALSMAKRLLDQSSMLSIDDMAELEAYGQSVAVATVDHREGVAAFHEKRQAEFSGS